MQYCLLFVWMSTLPFTLEEERSLPAFQNIVLNTRSGPRHPEAAGSDALPEFFLAGGGGGEADPEAIHNFFNLKNYVTKIML
jgi:hypothetical protein